MQLGQLYFYMLADADVQLDLADICLSYIENTDGKAG
jgi:hypothetical protein